MQGFQGYKHGSFIITGDHGKLCRRDGVCNKLKIKMRLSNKVTWKLRMRSVPKYTQSVNDEHICNNTISRIGYNF
jgi:hypothetical protein